MKLFEKKEECPFPCRKDYWSPPNCLSTSLPPCFEKISRPRPLQTHAIPTLTQTEVASPLPCRWILSFPLFASSYSFFALSGLASFFGLSCYYTTAFGRSSSCYSLLSAACFCFYFCSLLCSYNRILCLPAMVQSSTTGWCLLHPVFWNLWNFGSSLPVWLICNGQGAGGSWKKFFHMNFCNCFLWFSFSYLFRVR